jgi:hypothetical protein
MYLCISECGDLLTDTVYVTNPMKPKSDSHVAYTSDKINGFLKGNNFSGYTSSAH